MRKAMATKTSGVGTPRGATGVHRPTSCDGGRIIPMLWLTGNINMENRLTKIRQHITNQGEK